MYLYNNFLSQFFIIKNKSTGKLHLLFAPHIYNIIFTELLIAENIFGMGGGSGGGIILEIMAAYQGPPGLDHWSSMTAKADLAWASQRGIG